MATGPKGVCRELKTLFHLGVVGSLSDAQLLEEFLARSGDAAEDAFAAVVERHGPMVLRVCRRILTEPHDAEDAFQVTFLVLARKARMIARREQLTNWLYGVAVRTAKEVRKSSARRRAREGRMDEMVRTASPREEDVDELRLVIDDELSRLPESFRAPSRALRSGGKNPEGGGPAPGCTRRHGIEPAVQRPQPVAPAADAARPGTPGYATGHRAVPR